VILWQLASTRFDQVVLPSPLATAEALAGLVASGELQEHIGITIMRIGLGFTLGSAIGVASALVAGEFLVMRYGLDPYINFLRFVPAIALLTPLIVWFGIGEESKVALITFATLFIVAIQGFVGMDNVPVNRVRAGLMLGGSRWELFWHIKVPSALPWILTGMRVAMGISFASIIVGEMLAANSGLGYLLVTSRTFGAIDVQFVAIFCLGALGFAADKLFIFAGRTLFPHQVREA
jgi:NitT/TauT family transport system permease protein